MCKDGRPTEGTEMEKREKTPENTQFSASAEAAFKAFADLIQEAEKKIRNLEKTRETSVKPVLTPSTQLLKKTPVFKSRVA
tara:strand:+ start:1609 stop:1851 length:243 start_codon:yes stop_codon:yes gene_type:complete